MKKNKYFSKLWLTSLVLALALLSGCNSKEAAFKELPSTPAVLQPADELTTTTEGIKSEEDPDAVQGTSQDIGITEAEIHFIDTGNSDAVLIMNAGQAMLVDGGENNDEQFLVDYLKKQGVTKLDYLIATHPHADHVGGLDAVVSNIDVETVFVANGSADTKVYTDFINAVMDKGLTPSVPLPDSQFKLGSGYFTVMNTDGGSDANNESLVVEYVNGEDKILLMADAEKEVEDEILPELTQVDLLKVGHHGSRTSTSSEFLSKVNPTYAVILCGKDNDYGHPHKETMEKLKGIHIHRTDECGTIIFRSTGKGVETDCKEADFTPGTKKGKSDDEEAESSKTTTNKVVTSNTTSSKPTNNNATSNNTSTSSEAPVQKPATTPIAEQADSTKVVYWTPNGKSYHASKDCPTLSRSKVINSGTISESGKTDPCDKCYK